MVYLLIYILFICLIILYYGSNIRILLIYWYFGINFCLKLFFNSCNSGDNSVATAVSGAFIKYLYANKRINSNSGAILAVTCLGCDIFDALTDILVFIRSFYCNKNMVKTRVTLV